MRTAVIVPAYNEERTVGAVVRSLAADGHEVIVVDDGSADRTGEAARRAGARVIRHVLNRGLGAAIGTGVAAALRGPAEVLVTFDADGQHRAEDIPRLVAPLGAGTATIEVVRPRPILRQANFLHLNHAKRLWTWMADLYAVALGLLAVTGLFVLRGRKGITGRGAWLTGAGVVLPFVFLWLYL